MCKQAFAFSARGRKRLFLGQPPQKPAHEQHEHQRRQWDMNGPGEHRRHRQGPYRNCQAMVHNLIVEAPAKQIDYVLVRCGDHGPTLEVVGCERAFDGPVDGVWASDHFGVVADLRLP